MSASQAFKDLYKSICKRFGQQRGNQFFLESRRKDYLFEAIAPVGQPRPTAWQAQGGSCVVPFGVGANAHWLFEREAERDRFVEENPTARTVPVL